MGYDPPQPEITFMPQTETLSPRLQALKDELVRSIPIQKAADRTTLASKALPDVVIQYLSWRARLIRPRLRAVIIWPEVTNSPNYPIYKEAIERIKAGLEAGRNMNAYLSHQVRRNAYAGDIPKKTAAMTQEEWVKKLWKGKDRMRVTVDAHHLHLGAENPDGTVERDGPLLFVGVGHDQAFLLTIGDHASFDDGTVSKLMHEKLDAAISRAGGGIGLAGPGITLAGTQVNDTFKAIKLIEKLKSLDADLTQQGFQDASQRRFMFDDADIVVLDPATGVEISRHM
jgi:hypothetical protein